MSDPSDSTESRPAAPSQASTRAVPQRSFGTWLRDMPRWKKVAVGTGLLVAVLGGAWSLSTGQSPTAGGSGQAGLSAALIDSPPTGGGGSGATAAEEPTSKGVFRLGFSFLAGFCVGSFLRATLKLAAIAVGFWLLMTFALAYYGLVNVDWTAIDSLWQRFSGNVADEWGNFSRFMLGSLPATGLAATGLAIGLKRH